MSTSTTYRTTWGDDEITASSLEALRRALRETALAEGAITDEVQELIDEAIDDAEEVVPRETMIAEAVERLDASEAEGEGWVYHDDGTQLDYLVPTGDESDLVDLYDLMHSDDKDIARNPYSHWCSGNNHSVFALSVWVSNQPDGVGSDCTEDYIKAADVDYRKDGRQTLIAGGTRAEQWEAFLAARKAVAEAGHGAESDDLAAPELVACLPDSRDSAETLQRDVSRTAQDWETFANQAGV